VRVLVVNADYEGFVSWLYGRHPGLDRASYREQLKVRYDSIFGVADFYSHNLQRLGVEASDLYVNNRALQQAWMREQYGPAACEVPDDSRPTPVARLRTIAGRTPLRRLKPFLTRWLDRQASRQRSWVEQVLVEQIRHYRPDVVLNQDMCWAGGQFWREMKPYIRLLVGQIASPLPEDRDFGAYDLVVSSLPNFVDYFKRQGVKSELHRLAFDPRVLEIAASTADAREPIDLSFVGSLTADHRARVRLLETLSEHVGVQVWGRGVDSLSASSPLRRCWKGEAWGMDMYRVLARSRITINHHIDVSEGFANNMRLFEATGVGSLLVTDWKANLSDMFEPGKEIVAYRHPEECVRLVRHYLAHESARAAVARAGQERTLRDHTYLSRMTELVEIVKRYL
jgi:hypothetical protein